MPPTVTITAPSARFLYELILDRLSAIGDLNLGAEQTTTLLPSD